MRTGWCWLRAVHVKSREAQTLRLLLAGHSTLLGKVIDMENMIRSLIRPFGLKVGQVSTGKFDARVRELVEGRTNWRRSLRTCWKRARLCAFSSPGCTAWHRGLHATMRPRGG